MTFVKYKAGNTPEQKHSPGHTELARCASADEDRLGSLLDPIHVLSVHQSEPSPSHGRLCSVWIWRAALRHC